MPLGSEELISAKRLKSIKAGRRRGRLRSTIIKDSQPRAPTTPARQNRLVMDPGLVPHEYCYFPNNPLISSYGTAPSVSALNVPEFLASEAMRRSRLIAAR